MQTLVIVLYLITLGVLALYGAHRSALLFLYLRHRHEQTAPRFRFDETNLPMVTIQLPMFNEMFVAERLIDAAARVDYPRDRLEIQVLDDSTDATSTIARSKCDALRDDGLDVAYLHRVTSNRRRSSRSQTDLFTVGVLRQETIEVVCKLLLVALTERGGPTAHLDTARSHGVEEVTHVETRTNIFLGVHLTARA